MNNLKKLTKGQLIHLVVNVCGKDTGMIEANLRKCLATQQTAIDSCRDCQDIATRLNVS
ncbi:hypothetical protein LCGC14_0365760 [marine sediment metagenome]|uniref:Uncharacterized protein n=1 Tax=marine sediment metagenome TaxID=412755 RepID=A0A0F9TCN3_9ZZZZ